MRSAPLVTVALWISVLVFAGPAPRSSFGRTLDFDAFISLGRVSDPQISPDGKRVAFVVTTYSKEENKGNSDIYMVALEGGKTRRLTNSPQGDSRPRFSPDGEWIAFTSSRSGKSQIWILPTGGGEARQVTDLATGASGAEWTPDGKELLFTSDVYPDCPDDSCNAKRVAEKEKSKVQARLYSELLYRHWDAWRDERRSHLFITPAEGGRSRDLTPGDVDVPTFTLGSGSDYAVSPDGKEICVVANTDKNPAFSINNDLFVMPADGGPMKRITDNPANDNHPVYSPDGRYIAYRAMSRPGFEADRYRLMLYDRTGGTIREAAEALAGKFDRSVGSIAWAPDSRAIYVTCADAGYQSLYRVDIHKRDVTPLTEKMLVSSPRATPDGKRLVFLRQSARAPYEVFVCDAKGKNIRPLSRVNDEALAAVDRPGLEAFWYPGAGGTNVHGFLLKPPGFDPAKKYPMIYLVHGGPQGDWSDEWHWRWNYQMFASPGYVVVAVNPRGSTGYGQQFTDEISRDWGGKVFEDLMKGLDHVLVTYPFIDSDRLAAAGASYGGYMMNWFEAHTDRFKCLVNHDGLYNLTSFYGSTEELWFPEWDIGGTPWENPEDYARYSPHMFAKNFKTPMLVIHGGLDYRVDLSEGLQTYTALKRQGVPAKFLYFPDEGHWVQKPLNAELWWKTVHKWVAEWVR